MVATNHKGCDFYIFVLQPYGKVSTMKSCVKWVHIFNIRLIFFRILWIYLISANDVIISMFCHHYGEIHLDYHIFNIFWVCPIFYWGAWLLFLLTGLMSVFVCDVISNVLVKWIFQCIMYPNYVNCITCS